MSHCIHFGSCGGCAFDDPAALRKETWLRAALLRAGYDAAPIAPVQEIPRHSRRRVDLAATRSGGLVSLGLHKAGGAEVVDMRECALIDPRIVALLAPLRELLRRLDGFRRAASVMLNWLENGPDLLLRLDAEISVHDRNKMVAFADSYQLPRISFAKGDGAAEPVVIRAAPVITLSGIGVEPPPGAFLQASAAGEAAIIAAVLAGLPELAPKSRVVELYAGIGTITFALAKLARVAAYEGNAPAAAAADRAVRRHGLAGRVSVSQRDLARRPLRVSELAGCAAVVLDPPYAGAPAQAQALAAAGVPRIVYVSCNPAALASDALPLQRAGYELRAATPIDQFPYTRNLESVSVFGRDKRP